MIIGYILLFGSMLLFLAMLGFILPGTLLRVRYADVQTSDRGLRRFLFKGKRCVLYEVAQAQRKYVSRYLIWQENGYKLVKCQVASDIRFLEYDIVVYDRYKRIIDVIRTRENLLSVYTRPVELPNETAYISLRLRKVDKKTLDTAALISISRQRMVGYATLACLLALIEGFVIKVGAAYAFGDVFREAFIYSGKGTLISLGITFGVAMIASFFTLIPLWIRSRK